MAFRKTSRVLAEIAGRREAIIAAAVHIIHKQGADALIGRTVAERAKLSVGLIYSHFPDMDELRAFVFAQMLAHDLDVVRAAGNLEKGIRALTLHLMTSPKTTAALSSQPTYRNGIRKEFAKLISGDEATILAGVVTGAVLEGARCLKPGDEPALARALLRAVGTRALV